MVESMCPLPAVGLDFAPVSVIRLQKGRHAGSAEKVSNRRWVTTALSSGGPAGRSASVACRGRESVACRRARCVCNMSAVDMTGCCISTAKHRRQSGRAPNFPCMMLQSIPEDQFCRGQQRIATLARGHQVRHCTEQHGTTQDRNPNSHQMAPGLLPDSPVTDRELAGAVPVPPHCCWRAAEQAAMQLQQTWCAAPCACVTPSWWTCWLACIRGSGWTTLTRA